MTLHAALNYGLFLFAGALAYWLPDITLHVIALSELARFIGITLFVTGFTIGICFWLRTQFPQHPKAVPLLMLLGVWALGPLGIAIGMVPSGGSFLHADKIGDFLGLWLRFPIATFVMSTYSGSLGGVILITVALRICTFVGDRGLEGSHP